MSTGTDKIVSSIVSDAQIKAKALTEEAEKRNSSILLQGEEKALIEKNKILSEAEKQANLKYQQVISEAKMNSRRMELEAREEVIEESFKIAEKKLKEIASSGSLEYMESLKRIITEAAIEIGGGELIVLLKKDDVSKIKNSIDSIKKEVTDKIGVKTELEIGDNINTIGGVIVKTKNGEIEINNTIETRLLRFKKTLRSEVAKILFK
jgi:V/A-type H+-transporting ATPase subunit E